MFGSTVGRVFVWAYSEMLQKPDKNLIYHSHHPEGKYY